MRIRDLGIAIGRLPTGPQNAITDVTGVAVGHVTLSAEEIQTGVTAILPHGGNLFADKVPAAFHVINGFGKTIGTIQIGELGEIETPIILTNTLSVGTCAEAVVEHALQQNPDIGIGTGTVNPIVCECNDSYLNDIRGFHVKKEHVYQAIAEASTCWSVKMEGAVGAGTGMSCYGLKGGIGSSSRQIIIDSEIYTVGVLSLTNFGRLPDLVVDGIKVGEAIYRETKVDSLPDKGSVIVIVATDLPVSDRQLRRIAMRASAGLARTGSYIGHGSGDLVLAFSTANQISHSPSHGIRQIIQIHDSYLEGAFQAVVEGTEESVLNSMIAAKSTIGRAENYRQSLQDFNALLKER